jgi:L-serine kinase (ADP)
MKLIKLHLLKPIEGASCRRVNNMFKKITLTNIWKKPICIEEKNLLILDGHHRFEVAKKMGLKYIPCVFFNYKDPNLVIRSLRKEEKVEKDIVIRRALMGDIYPYKTVKHIFPIQIRNIDIDIQEIINYSCQNDDDIIDCTY